MNRILIATLVGLSALTAGCSGVAGDPTPTPTTGGSSTPTSDNNSSQGLNALKPCDLLTDAEATTFDAKLPGEEDKIGPAAICDWTIPGNGGLQVGIRASQGVKDLNAQGDKVSEVKVGKFSATKVEAQDGSKSSCAVLISASDTSSVAVLANMLASSTDTAAACERATKAAELIAPKLP
ncbi:hypothetical protein BBK82_20630 [Lentzea guizhouensis]|uniref:DUF3558 domain-containing protein n=1 Tax=Lentzea guizhouensis TaxID=1586287 RepID=A0A1B2HKA0_9PSEU|nr:DUF3558 domain-containing protein [Lentzea guizhouensis]ANZ38110.1 hypothetical protein BBK82_20630 [Lentzea guizhouensis]